MDLPPTSKNNRKAVSSTALRRALSSSWRANQLGVLWSVFVTTLAAAIVCATVLKQIFPYLILSALSVFITYLIFRSATSRLQSKTNEIENISQLHFATAEALATAIDAKDQTTHCHVRRLQVYAAGMGEVFGLSPDDIAALNAGALLHDVGKLAVPSHILNKPGRLTPAEFERMKVHTVVGAQILSRVNFPYPVIPIIRHHHEQW
ncbi:MAG TPA: HD domain-containing protein, partial [Pyrinomonadaceae bacterium]